MLFAATKQSQKLQITLKGQNMKESDAKLSRIQVIKKIIKMIIKNVNNKS